MNEEPDFQHPADDSQDPLLRALRERLGAGFGQEPPPAAWAGIRRRLPAAPRPWWRGRRLLPLLALFSGLLLVGGLAVRQARRAARAALLAAPQLAPAKAIPAPLASQSARLAPASGQAGSQLSTQPNNRPPLASLATRPTAGATAPATGANKTTETNEASGSAVAARVSSAALAAPTRAATTATTRGIAKSVSSQSASSGQSTQAASPLAATTDRRRHGRLAQATSPGTQLALTRHRVASTSQLLRKRPPSTVASGTPAAALTAPRRQLTLARASRAANYPAAVAEPSEQPLSHRQRRASQEPAPAVTRSGLATSRAMQALAASPALVRPEYLDSLAGRQPAIAVGSSSLPSPLAPRPDSAGRWLPVGRRWAVLVLAGPALSYRTEVAPWATTTQRALAAASPTNSTYTSPTAGASTFDQERPALGWGAQVQVRRVLAGRWRLALGVGYQEYATQLNLPVKTAASSTSTMRPDTTSTAARQRDTYRLLTLPVQLEYALGPPHGRLALGLLAGFEPSWYVGGRTTENTGCNCQQVFSGASGSPYNALSLAFSLGLAARYRLGGPAGRWQLLVQPTGRYIATRFVRSTGLGYALRQPYNLGVLTGLAWDF